VITCRELAESLFDLVSGQLPIQRREEIVLHLTHCRSCVAYAEGYRLTVWVAARLPRQPLPSHLLQRLESLFPGDQEGREG